MSARIWVLGWHRTGTGFTRVLERLVAHFAESAPVLWFGIGDDGPPRSLAARVELLPVRVGRGDPVGAYLARERLQHERPAWIFCLNDLWYLEHYARVLGPVRDGVPMDGYLPLDGDVPDDLVLPDLSAFDRLVTYTRHAADTLRNALARGGQAVEVQVAGHGVALDRFYPGPGVTTAADPLSLRMQWAQDCFGLDAPARVVLNASRPDPRKRIDLSLAAFAQLARGRGPDLKLCLHQAIAHAETAAALCEQARALGIADRLLMWPRRPGALPDPALNRLYNACAIGLNTSAGEGFGLISFEHAATGVPQVLPDHAALRELWGDAAALAGPVHARMTPHSPLRMGEVAIAGVAEALAAMVDDPDHYRRSADRALARTRRPDLDWAQVASILCRLS
ncbi:MAG TPA: glycosyltransferase [Pseudomonadota bacterium]|nr:glycosyltransferase [Pseudomonadota bacterium]